MCYVKHKMKMNDHLWQFNISSVEKKKKNERGSFILKN